jgi:hypothetical protein
MGDSEKERMALKKSPGVDREKMPDPWKKMECHWKMGSTREYIKVPMLSVTTERVEDNMVVQGWIGDKP